MQNNAAKSLVRNSATPSNANQSHSSENPARTDPDVQPHKGPTPRQQEALNELRFFKKPNILAWLAILRCIEPGFRYSARGGCLSSQQLDALSSLKDCDDSDILAWLNLSFPSGDVDRQPTSISTVRASDLSAPRHQRRSSTKPSPRSSASSLAPSSTFSNSSGYGTQRSSLSYSAALSELPEDFAYNDESDHAHWCTYGEHSKQIGTCNAWKRHEREHEVPYLCMPHGPVEDTMHGRRCALCGIADPDKAHLAMQHNISLCKFKEPIKKSRRTDMIRHLALHRVHSEKAAALADQWRFALNKKFFSCGLCVAIFPSITERSNHIDNEHWRQGQNMDAWQLTNCIRGLLLERKVQAAWRCLLVSYPDVVESNLRWEMPLAEGLQLRLEKGEESPPVLAEAALQLSICGQPRPGLEGLRIPTDEKDMIFGPVSAALSKSTNLSLPGHTQLHDPMTRHLPSSLSPSNVASFGTGFPDLDRDPSLSAAFDGSFQPKAFFNESLWQAGLPVDLNSGNVSSQLSDYALSTEWQPIDTSQPIDDNTRIRSHLNETGAQLIGQMSSSRHGQIAAQAGIAGQGPMLDSPGDVITSNIIRVPTSAFSHDSAAQLLNDEYGTHLRNKPLPKPPPDLPGNESRAPERRPTTPMDLTTC